MTDPLRALDQYPDVVITIQQGTEYFRDGQITLIVHGDGRLRVEQRRSGAVHPFEAQLPPPRIAELGRALARHRFTAARTTKLPRNPGDTPLVLRLDGGGSARFAAELWNADRYQDADLDAIVRQVDALVHEATAGQFGQAPG